MKIDKDVEVPHRNKPGQILGLYEGLKDIGDSMLLGEKAVGSLMALASKKGQRGRFRRKKVGEGLFRVWRVK